jgi:predicted transposase YdaD
MYIYMYKMIGLGKLEPIDITSLEDVTMSLVQERMKIYDQSLIEEGRQEGRREALASLSLALELRSKGLSMQDIQQKTQLPLELLQTLMKV